MKPKTLINKLKLAVVMLLFALPFAIIHECHGQKCKYLKNEVDEFTGAVVKQLDFETIGPSVLGMAGMHISNQDTTFIGIIASIQDLGCAAQNRSSVYFKFDDEEILQLTHSGDTNCKTTTAFIMNITDNITSFREKSILKLRLFW